MGIFIKWNKVERNSVISNRSLSTKRMSQWTKHNGTTAKEQYEATQMITTYSPSYAKSTFDGQSLPSTHKPSFSTVENSIEDKTWIISSKSNNSITSTVLSSSRAADHISTTFSASDYKTSLSSAEHLLSSSTSASTTTFSTPKLIPSLQSLTLGTNSSASIASTATSSLSAGTSTSSTFATETKNIWSTIPNNNTLRSSMKRNSDNRNDNIINLNSNSYYNSSNDRNNFNDSIEIKNDIADQIKVEDADFNDYDIKYENINSYYQTKANSDESNPLNDDNFEHLSSDQGDVNKNYTTLKYQRYQNQQHNQQQQQQQQHPSFHYHQHNYLLQHSNQQEQVVEQQARGEQYQPEVQHKYYHQLFTRAEDDSFPLDNRTIGNMTTATATANNTLSPARNSDGNRLFLIMDDFNEYLVNYNTNGITATNIGSLNATITDVDYPLHQFNLTNFDYRNECKDFYNVTNLTTSFNICETHNATTTVHEG